MLMIIFLKGWYLMYRWLWGFIVGKMSVWQWKMCLPVLLYWIKNGYGKIWSGFWKENGNTLQSGICWILKFLRKKNWWRSVIWKMPITIQEFRSTFLWWKMWIHLLLYVKLCLNLWLGLPCLIKKQILSKPVKRFCREPIKIQIYIRRQRGHITD